MIDRGYGKPEDWDDMFYDRAEQIEAEGGEPPEEWLRAQGREPSDGTRVVMDGTVELDEHDELATSDL